jgi:hypothetical protein
MFDDGQSQHLCLELQEVQYCLQLLLKLLNSVHSYKMKETVSEITVQLTNCLQLLHHVQQNSFNLTSSKSEILIIRRVVPRLSFTSYQKKTFINETGRSQRCVQNA